jgi:hypothetical protein
LKHVLDALLGMMAPKWPLVNNGLQHVNEHTIYLKEAYNQLQHVERGKVNQAPWNIVKQHAATTLTLALIGKLLQKPVMSEVFQQIQDAAKCD